MHAGKAHCPTRGDGDVAATPLYRLEIQPQALARLVGWKMTLRELALRMRCSKCGKKAAEVVAVARPRPRAPK